MCCRSFPPSSLGLSGLALLVSVMLTQSTQAAAPTAAASPLQWKTYSSSVVSAAQLRHPVVAKARDEMEKGQKALQHASIDDAIRHYKLAIAADSSLVVARNNLAICFMQSDPPAAVDQLEQAIKVDPRHPVLYKNLALAYASSERLRDAERAGRTAVHLDRTGDQSTRFVLGWVLVSEHKYTDETLTLLDGAGDTIPLAHLLAGRVLLGKGEYAGAMGKESKYE